MNSLYTLLFSVSAILYATAVPARNLPEVDADDTTTLSPATTTPPNYANWTISCGFAHAGLDIDIGNYGDGVCTFSEDHGMDRRSKLLVRDTLINYNAEHSLHYEKLINNTVITWVSVLNFGRHHGFVKSIDIWNLDAAGNVTVDVDTRMDIFEQEYFEVRMFVEIYGYDL